MGEVVAFPWRSRQPAAVKCSPSAEQLSDLLHDRSKRGALTVETRYEQIRGHSGVSVYCNGRFRGVWICRDLAYDWVPPSYTHPICRAQSAAAAVEHTLVWLNL